MNSNITTKRPTKPLLAALALLIATSSSTSSTYVEGRRSSGAANYYHRGLSALNGSYDPMELLNEILHLPKQINEALAATQSDTTSQSTVEHQDIVPGLDNFEPIFFVQQNTETGASELTMEVPGVYPKDIVVELENERLLRIEGSRKYVTPTGVKERSFKQSFQLDSDADAQNLKVTLSAGILHVTAPKKPRITRKLEIGTVSSEEAPVAVPSSSKNDAKDPQKEEQVQTEEAASKDGQDVVQIDGMTITTEDSRSG